MVDVTYGILHYNPGANTQAREAFRKAACSLAENTSLSHEVFVIDQGNPTDEMQYNMELCRVLGFNFISLSKNAGISRGINMLANMGRGKYISLVTSDVEFTQGLDQVLVQTLEKNPDIWQICPASDQSDIPYQRRGYLSDGLVFTVSSELTIQFWPRYVFERIGYFDERWKACYENLDYSMRIIMAGGYPAISHDAFCPHDFHMSMRTGARDHAYEGYAGMKSGFDQSVLQQIWENKWPALKYYLDLYRPIDPKFVNDLRTVLMHQYTANLRLPYVQAVGY